MKKKIVLALCSLLIATSGIGMSSIPHEEQPISQELLVEAVEKEKEDIIEEIATEKVCVKGCILETDHEGECVLEEVEDIQVILKATSMERDLKVKFVDKKTGKLISGADFKMKLTSPSKKTKEYSDDDGDGIIWVKGIEGGTYVVEMLELEGYATAASMKAEVKKKIEYKVVEIVEEVKKESEIVVSQEDAAYGGTNKDESTSSSPVLQDTVELVASTKKEVVKNSEIQKKDAFGQPMYEKQAVDAFGQKVYKELKKDEFGTPMYAKIKSEPAAFHKDDNKDNVCDRCGQTLKAEQPEVPEVKPETPEVQPEVPEKIPEVQPEMPEEKPEVPEEQPEVPEVQPETPEVQPEVPEVPEETPEVQPEVPEETPEKQPEIPETPETGTGQPESEVQPQNEQQPENSVEEPIVGFVFRPFSFLSTAREVIVYDTTSAPVYDETSAPVYDTSSAPVYESETTYIYTGWQTIDGLTYYFDKNGNKVTGQQVIEGISYTFSSEGVRSGNIGIDVSKYQTGINWTKVKNAGINFVMIRCGYRGYGSGVLVEDPMYASHIRGAKAAGLRVGVYFFSQAINEAEAVEEASMAVALARKYGINMPIAIDSEYAAGGRGRADGLSKSARTTITKAFCNTIQSAGYTPMVYASKAWFSDHLNVSALSGYRIWVAHYSDKCGYTGNYHIWQNTDKGKVDGIPGYVDMNISSI